MAEIYSIYYLVQPGDTLKSISHDFGIPVNTLAITNGIRDVSSVQAGRKLFISYSLGFDGSSRTITGTKGEQETGAQAIAKAPTGTSTSEIRYGDGRLAWPLVGGTLVSRFGPRRGSFHDGIDIAARSGTPVLAAHDATVAYSGSKLSGYGKLIILRDNQGITTVYAHNRRLLVEQGERVKRGQKIAEVGATGRAEGPHLHFEVRMFNKNKRHVAVDPIPLFRKEGGAPPRYRVNESLLNLIK